jgi:hypothetical protein
LIGGDPRCEQDGNLQRVRGLVDGGFFWVRRHTTSIAPQRLEVESFVQVGEWMAMTATTRECRMWWITWHRSAHLTSTDQPQIAALNAPNLRAARALAFWAQGIPTSALAYFRTDRLLKVARFQAVPWRYRLMSGASSR